MKSDKQLLAELTGFAFAFKEKYNLFSYKDGAYINALGDMEIDDIDWINSEKLRIKFDSWINDNGFLQPNIKLNIDFDTPSIKIFVFIKEIK